MQSSLVRKLFVLLLLTVLLLGVWTGCGRDNSADAGGAASKEVLPIAVEALEVSSGFLVPEIRSSGVVEGIKDAWVVSEVSGLVEQVNYSLGDRVPAGFMLLAVDSSLARKNRDLAKQRYLTAKLEYSAAEKAKNSGSMSLLDFSRTTDRLLAAEAAWTGAEKAYANCFLKAPFAGVVALRDKNIGIGTLLNPGVRVARIVDDSSFQTEIGVGEGQVLLVREGDNARITSRDGEVYEGSVRAVSAGSEGKTGSYTVVVAWEADPERILRPGMTVDVAVDVTGEEERVILPSSVIRMRGDRHYVFVEKDGWAASREIFIGSSLGGRVEVLKGLQNGEIVISSGLASLSEGARVKVTPMGQTGTY